MSTNDNDKQTDEAERKLIDFFRGERPHSWPEPPWRRLAAAPRGRRAVRGKLVLVAALVLAALGLSFLGEVPSSWPGSRDAIGKGKLEASRPNSKKKPAPLPGFRVPEAAKKDKGAKP